MASISRAFQNFKKRIRVRKALNELSHRMETIGGRQKTHGLPHPLIVSLTSYPARYDTLATTLKCVLHQTVKADHTILWIAHDDFSQLPADVLELQKIGLEIGQCQDIRSYKKIIPTIQTYPDNFIITADDDVYYQENFIEQLVAAYDHSNPRIICHRAHEIALTPGGAPQPYPRWRKITKRETISPLVFPTGVLGVLYPPGIFHEDICNQQLFSTLCPTADDVWLYWMWRMNGHLAHKIHGRKRILEWPTSQTSYLHAHNIDGNGNDLCIQNMLRKYGFPA